MPCYRCHAVQTDPARGPSAWRRGVRGGEFVLVCPACQSGGDWTADLDRCPACGSTDLRRALGETTCRACGRPVPAPVPAADPAYDDPPAPAAPVSDAVAAALARRFGRG